jgi:hypothetical protein
MALEGGGPGHGGNFGATLRHRDDGLKAAREDIVAPCVFAADPVCLAGSPFTLAIRGL